MIRIFLFLLLVLILGFGFSWFADRPGDVVLQWQGNQYETSLMVVLVGIVALVAVVMIVWWLGRTIIDSPQIMRRFFRARKKDRGYQALSNGLIAANSGDVANARRYTKESMKLLGQQPLVELLDAQALLLEGNREEARGRFEKMLLEDDTRLVALRGLYLQAEREGAGDAARHYAEEAQKDSPSLAWAGNAKLRYACKDGDWESALATLEANRSAGHLTKEEAKRQRAVLLTASAMSVEPGDPVRAAKLAREAHKLAPKLVPAAIIGAKALARNSDIGRASGILEAVWKKEPHPEIAQSYVHLRLGDAAADRLKRAKKLAAMKPNNLEGNFAIAEAAIDVEDWKLAREAMMPILKTAPSERACLIMADIEEGQSGDQGRMREWLSRAVRAPKDATWTADGYVSEKWLPISPVTGKIDAFEWKVPVEQLGIEHDRALEPEGLEDLIREPQPQPPVVEVAEQADGDLEKVANVSASAGTEMRNAGATAGAITATNPEGVIEFGKEPDEVSREVLNPVPEEPALDMETARSDSGEPSSNDNVGGASEKSDAEAVVSQRIESSIQPKIEEHQNKDTGISDKNAKSGFKDSAADTAIEKEDNADNEDDPETGFPLKRRPDDPGIRPEYHGDKPNRFGLF